MCVRGYAEWVSLESYWKHQAELARRQRDEAEAEARALRDHNARLQADLSVHVEVDRLERENERLRVELVRLRKYRESMTKWLKDMPVWFNIELTGEGVNLNRFLRGGA